MESHLAQVITISSFRTTIYYYYYYFFFFFLNNLFIYLFIYIFICLFIIVLFVIYLHVFFHFQTNDSTALHLAAKGGHKEVVRVLVEYGASPTEENAVSTIRAPVFGTLTVQSVTFKPDLSEL